MPVPATQEAIQVAKGLAGEIGGKASRFAATGSMLPLISEVDLIVYRPVTFDEIKVGDVIVAEQGEKTSLSCQACALIMFAHRVVAKTDKYLITKGDNNPEVDEFHTTEKKLHGLLVYVVDGQTGTTRDLTASIQ